jgi:chromosome segregation ATPase
MRSLWVAAVEQGEHVFNEHRQALESDLETQKRTLDDVVVERDAAQAAVHQLQHEVSQLREQGIEVRQQLIQETEAKRDALGQVQALQHEVAAVRTDMAQQLEAARQAHDRLTTEFQATIAARDAAFQAERDKANERMEAAQARMLQETDAAREGQRHSEQQLAKLRHRSEDRQNSLTELRLDMARLRRELAEGEARLGAMASVTGERDQLALKLAGTLGQVTGLTSALQSAEARAVAAESQLTVAHKRRLSKQK